MLELDFSKKIQIEQLPKEEKWQQEIITFLQDWYSASKVIITHTSGSTGIPKKIELTKEAMIQSAKMTGEFLNLREGDTALLCMPSLYIAGKMMLIRSIIWKLKLFCIKPVSYPLENINTEISFSAMTPMQVENSINKLHLVKKLIVGGAQITEHLLQRLKGLSTDIYESFGMTETISHIALKKVSNPPEATFKLLPNTQIRLDERNCLTIKPAFANEEINTNDLVIIISPNEFQWLGRIDNVINSGGIKIFPEEVEKQLKTVINSEFIISSQENPLLGNQVILIVEDEKNPELEKQIEKFEFKNKYEKPKNIYFIKKFQRTPTGKIIRKNIDLS